MSGTISRREFEAHEKQANGRYDSIERDLTQIKIWLAVLTVVTVGGQIGLRFMGY